MNEFLDLFVAFCNHLLERIDRFLDMLERHWEET